MEFAYRNRKNIARIALISFVLLLLTALNNYAWSGSTGKDDPPMLLNQSNEFVQGVFLSSGENIRNAVSIKQLLDTGFIGILFTYGLLSISHFYRLHRSPLLSKKGSTLVSLGVRMDE